jgi:hypothetical protein
MDVKFEVFRAYWPMIEGWYWRVIEHRLMRGPFPTEEEAHADVNWVGRDLVAPLILSDVRGGRQA